MAAPRAESAPPGVFSVAGHPLRWRLLRELAWSDRRVGMGVQFERLTAEAQVVLNAFVEQK